MQHTKGDLIARGNPMAYCLSLIHIYGQLKLHIGGDDGYRLFVNDKHITGDWGNHSYSSREVELPVECGKEHRFQLEFFDNISSAIIRFNAYSLNDAKLRQRLAKVDNVVFIMIILI